MACTLEDLQKAEYGMLCQFADFCDKYQITYGLAWGTLLGAVRHNGFVPWDDDIDIHMEVHEFKKLLRCLRKHPIHGLHLSWMDSEPDNPFFIAKLRKNGTFMPEPFSGLKNIDIHNGIWIDIFCYTGIPKSKKLAALQKKLLFYYRSVSHIIFFKYDPDIDHPLTKTKAYSLGMKMSNKNIFRIRKLLFWLYTNMGSRHSEEVLYNSIDFMRSAPRKYELPLCRHTFGDREFSIPQNYDEALTDMYGDYMTPKQFPSHADYANVQL
ncbi:MAG: LicD family protein [Clostridia bacterium]|nr:LicD family protein [Clostridia bacterium]